MKSKLRLFKEVVGCQEDGTYVLTHPVYDDMLLGVTMGVAPGSRTDFTIYTVRRNVVHASNKFRAPGTPREFTYMYMYDYDTYSALRQRDVTIRFTDDITKVRIIPVRLSSTDDPTFELIFVPDSSSKTQIEQLVYKGDRHIGIPIKVSDYTNFYIGTLYLKLEAIEDAGDVYIFTVVLDGYEAPLPALDITYNYELF